MEGYDAGEAGEVDVWMVIEIVSADSALGIRGETCAHVVV